MLAVTQVINGIGLAAPVLIIAIAVICAHAATRILNVAIGGTYIITAYIAIKAAAIPGTLPILLFVLTCLCIPVIMYVAIEYGIARQQRGSTEDIHLAGFGATLGVSILLSAVFAELTQGQQVVLPNTFPRIATTWQFGGLTLTESTVVLTGAAIVLTIAWSLYQSRSVAGRLYTATATEPFLAQAVGVRVRRVALQSWIISGLLTGVAAILLCIQQRAVGSDSAGAVLLTPFAAVIIGGLGDLTATIIAALVFGIGGSLVLFASGSSAFQDVFVFGLILLILLIRPQGLGRVQAGSRAY